VSERIQFRRKRKVASSRVPSIIALGFLVFAALSIFVLSKKSSRISGPVATATATADTESANESVRLSRRNAIVRASESVSPAVVSIGVVTTRVVRGRNPLYDNFFDSFSAISFRPRTTSTASRCPTSAPASLSRPTATS